MNINTRIIEVKHGHTWEAEDVCSDAQIVKTLLIDDMVSKYLFKAGESRIRYNHGEIIVTYSPTVRAIYKEV